MIKKLDAKQMILTNKQFQASVLQKHIEELNIEQIN